MVYALDLDPFIEEALGNAQIQSGLADPTAGINDHLLRDRTRGRKSAIEGSVARQIGAEPQATAFLRHLAQLEAFDPLDETLLDELQLGVEVVAPPQPAGASTDDEGPARRKLQRLRQEFDCVLYFALTAAQLTHLIVAPADWRRLVDNDSIERLARSRQALEMGIGVAAFHVTELRTLNGLRRPP